MAAKRWTDEQRQAALEAYRLRGPAAASDELGIPRETIKSWAKRSGLRAPVTGAARQEAVEAAELTLETRRLAMAEGLADDVERLRARLFASMSYAHVKVVSGGKDAAAEVETVWVECDMPTPADQLNLLRAIGTAVDKMQLLSGEATSRPDLGGYDLEAELRAYQQGVADRDAVTP